MKVFTETPSAAAPSSSRDLRPFAQAQADASRLLVALARRRGRRTGSVLDIGQVDVVAGHPDVHAPVGQRGRELGGGVGEEIEHATGHRAAEHVGDPLGHLGHRVVPELADGDHVRTQPVDHQ